MGISKRRSEMGEEKWAEYQRKERMLSPTDTKGVMLTR